MAHTRLIVGPREARAILERHGLAASRDRGQNFLTDPAQAARLVAFAGVRPDETVLEVGTGLGILTRALAEVAARVRTVEVDGGLVRALEAEALLPGPERVRLVHEDALQVDWDALLADTPEAPVRVVANLPYRVATPLLRRFLDLPRLAGVGVMVQREVADRMRARFGEPAYGSLSVLIAWTMQVEATVDLHPRCFYPVPRVTSTFLRMTPRSDGVGSHARATRATAGTAASELAAMERVLRAGFAHRRKTLVNALQTAGDFDGDVVRAALAALGVDARARAEALDPETWRQLAARLAEGVA